VEGGATATIAHQMHAAPNCALIYLFKLNQLFIFHLLSFDPVHDVKC
jgi:hypothetical protein